MKTSAYSISKRKGEEATHGGGKTREIDGLWGTVDWEYGPVMYF